MPVFKSISEMSIERQLLVGGTVFAIVAALVFVVYLMFFRVPYDVLFSDLSPADAAAIVEELERREVPFKLGSGETTILVPADQLSETKIAIAGSDLPIRGAVGFELFNESDMGLTEFAQKINYQRALQGELARTIIAMDEVEAARVHLAIPERAIFRGEKSVPKAAVTLHAKPGRVIGSESVGGIQKLVASAVNDLQLSDVSVLDDKGQVISNIGQVDEALAPEFVEKQAIEQYHRARIMSTLQDYSPGQKIGVEVTAISLSPDALSQARSISDEADNQNENSANGQKRNYRLLVRLSMAVTPAKEEELRVTEMIKDVIEYDEASGDLILIVNAAVVQQPNQPAAGATADWRADTSADSRPKQTTNTVQFGSWLWLLLVAIAAVAVLAMFRWFRREKGLLSPEDRTDFARQIDAKLAALEPS